MGGGGGGERGVGVFECLAGWLVGWLTVVGDSRCLHNNENNHKNNNQNNNNNEDLARKIMRVQIFSSSVVVVVSFVCRVFAALFFIPILRISQFLMRGVQILLCPCMRAEKAKRDTHSHFLTCVHYARGVAIRDSQTGSARVESFFLRFFLLQRNFLWIWIFN